MGNVKASRILAEPLRCTHFGFFFSHTDTTWSDNFLGGGSLSDFRICSGCATSWEKIGHKIWAEKSGTENTQSGHLSVIMSKPLAFETSADPSKKNR